MKIDPRWIGRKKRLKAYAEAHGIPVPDGFRINPVCGSSCRTLIRRVTRHIWGVDGETERWPGALDAIIRPELTIPQKALKIAMAERGVKEQPAGSNDGPRVREYQAVTGAYKAPWCASFTAWAYKLAGRALSGFNAAYVPSYVSAARQSDHGLRIVSADKARPGDLVCFDWGQDGVADHIGILASRVKSGRFSSVEGNTSYGNNSNGGQVMLRDRNTGQVQCFIRVV